MRTTWRTGTPASVEVSPAVAAYSGHRMTTDTWQWVDLFSEGGPFVAAAESVFRGWPGAPGWATVVDDLEAPGKLWSDGGSFCFFVPEDPGPMQLAWTSTRLLMIRWSEAGGSPVIGPEPATQTAMLHAATTARDDEEQLGELTLDDGLVVVAWAAIGGAKLPAARAEVEALAESQPRQVLRFNGGAAALTAVRLQPGHYRVSGVFDFYDEDHDRGGSWVQLEHT